MTIELPDYARKILEAYVDGTIQPGSLSHVTVTHTDDCPIWRGEFCDCKPVVTIVPADITGGQRGE